MFSATVADPASFPLIREDAGKALPDIYPAPLDPDVSLILEVGSGSESAFTQLVQRHQQALLNFFIRMGASSDGEDLVQETFIRVFRYRLQYRPSARFTTFLYHLARNVWADRGRRVVRFERIACVLEREVSIAQQPVPEPRVPRGDVEAALAQLSHKLREVIVLNIYQGLRYQEVADVLNIPLGTVKSRINLALAALKKSLHDES